MPITGIYPPKPTGHVYSDVEQAIHNHLAQTWASHEDRQYDGTPLLHIYGVDSAGHWHEIGNVPVRGGYSIEGCVQRWCQINGRQVVADLDRIVEVDGPYGLHFGVDTV